MSDTYHAAAIQHDDDPPVPLNVMIRAYRDEVRRLAEPESDIWWCAEYIADWGDELARRLAEAEARAARLRELATAEIAFSTALVDIVDVDHPAYPTWLDRESSRLAAVCYEHGDLDDGREQP